MAEIKIRELSVGDWVEIDGEPARALCLRIVGGLIFKGVSGQMYRCCGGMDFKPILLTPEILEKNGFVYSRVTRWYNCEIGDTLRTRIGVHFFGGVANRIEISSVDALDEDWNTIDVMINKPIKGVHQLQHALRLAGVEKEIEV